MLMTVIVQVQVQLRISHCVLLSESEPQLYRRPVLGEQLEEETNVNVVITNAVTPFKGREELKEEVMQLASVPAFTDDTFFAILLIFLSAAGLLRRLLVFNYCMHLA
jgi:hypothetical protein